MKITTLWYADPRNPDYVPTLMCAYDEYTFDEHCGEPDFYTKEKQLNPEARELIIDIPEAEVRKLFRAPVVKAKVEQPMVYCEKHGHEQKGPCPDCGNASGPFAPGTK